MVSENELTWRSFWRELPSLTEVPMVVWVGLSASVLYAGWEGWMAYLNQDGLWAVVSGGMIYVLFGGLLLTGIRFVNWLLFVVGVLDLAGALVRLFAPLRIFGEWDMSVFGYQVVPAQLFVLAVAPVVVLPSARRYFSRLVTLKGIKRRGGPGEKE